MSISKWLVAIYLFFVSLSCFAEATCNVVTQDALTSSIAACDKTKWNECVLRILTCESGRAQSLASSMNIKTLFANANNSSYKEDVNYIKFVDVENEDGIFRVGVGYGIIAKQSGAQLDASGSVNEIGIEAKPSGSDAEIRLDVFGIHSDSASEIYQAIPSSIDVDDKAIRKIVDGFGRAVKKQVGLVGDGSGDTSKMTLCPQVVKIIVDKKPKPNADINSDLKKTIALQVLITASSPDSANSVGCNNKYPNATLLFRNTEQALGGAASASAVTATANKDGRLVTQSYRRYRYVLVGGDAAIEGSGAALYIQATGLDASVDSLMSALFSIKYSRKGTGVQFDYFGGGNPAFLMADAIASEAIGTATYFTDVSDRFKQVMANINDGRGVATKIAIGAPVSTQADAGVSSLKNDASTGKLLSKEEILAEIISKSQSSQRTPAVAPKALQLRLY